MNVWLGIGINPDARTIMHIKPKFTNSEPEPHRIPGTANFRPSPRLHMRALIPMHQTPCILRKDYLTEKAISFLSG